jgi:hypothetical protein
MGDLSGSSDHQAHQPESASSPVISLVVFRHILIQRGLILCRLTSLRISWAITSEQTESSTLRQNTSVNVIRFR